MTPATQFLSTITSLMEARAAIVTTLTIGRVNKQAREYAIQGLYLVAIRSFEAFLEDQIYALATEKVRWTSRSIGGGARVRWSNRLRENRHEFIKDMVLRGKDYTDYLPYEKTMEVAKLLFIGGRPFTLLPDPERQTLRRCTRVRNYIAHRSEFARRKFINDYKGVKPLRVSNPKPIHYLDDQIRLGVTLFEHDLTQLAVISKILS